MDSYLKQPDTPSAIRHSYHVPRDNSPRAAQPRLANAPTYPTPAPRTPFVQTVPHNQRSNSFDKTNGEIYEANTTRLSDAVSYASFPNPDHRQKCKQFLENLRIYRHLFMNVYVHLLTCCSGRDLHLLVDKANIWNKWSCVQQLVHHSLMRQELFDLGRKSPCTKHQTLFSRLTNDDDSDLLCMLLYCRRRSELYKLCDKAAKWGCDSDAGEPDQVIELIWLFLQRPLPSQFMHRLRAQIYRLTRKSAYVPLDIRISPSAISNERCLGNGAYGIISKAVLKGRREVAIKKIRCGDLATRQQCRQMFACEAIVWKTLDHKNIVPFVGVVMDDSLDIRLVSQFFRNGSIRTYMKQHKFKYSESSTLARTWAKGLAEGLSYLHSHEPPIIHGDIKADNVLVDDDRCARLCDFGQSHSSDSGKCLDSTRVGLVACNPVHWMAPELMNQDDGSSEDGGDRAKATAESDIFSFGGVLYEIMSGRIPFEDHHIGEVQGHVKGGERPKRPGSIRENDPLWRVANECWADLPRNRPSATNILSRLG